MRTQWPLVQARLVQLLPTLAGWDQVDVHDGQPDSGDTGQDSDGNQSYCAVGYVEDEQGAGSFTQTPEGSGSFDGETGEVRSELFTGNGDGDMAAARTAGFTLIDSLKAYIATHRDLGALAQGSTVSLAADVITGKQAGAGQLLILTVSYTAPIT